MAWALGLLAVGAGALLLLGFLTPIAAAVILAQGLAVRVSWLPDCSGQAVDSPIGVLFRIAVPLAIIGLGPGAFSLDAHVFGRREVIIPPAPRSES